MLENNSDRTLYMVGAVIIAAVVLILAKPMFDGIFTNIGVLLTDTTNNLISKFDTLFK